MTEFHPQLDPAKTGPVARKVYDLTRIPGRPSTEQQQAAAMKEARQSHLAREVQAEAQRRGWDLWMIRGAWVLDRRGFRPRNFPTLQAATTAVWKLPDPLVKP